MTDKVQKIREEVVRMHNLLPVMDGDNISVNYADRICTTLEMYIDSLQEEPVSKRYAFKAIPRLLEMIEPTDRAKAYIAKLADTLEVEGYSTDAKIVRESLKIMNGEKVAMATMDEEPVSEDLEEAAENYATTNEVLPNGKVMINFQAEKAFMAGSKWQKEQMMAKAVEGDITFDYYGDDDKIYGCIAHNSFCLEDFGLKDRDKVKMILIKEG